MKRLVFLLLGVTMASLIFKSYADISCETVRVYPENDSTCYISFQPDGKDVIATVHNVAPDYWNSTYIPPTPFVDAVGRLTDGKLAILVRATFGGAVCPPIEEPFLSQPFYDVTFTIPDVPYGVYNLEYEITGLSDNYISWKSIIDLDGKPLILKEDSNISGNIVREGIEWVLYQPEPDNGVKFYRLQFKGIADVFLPESSETYRNMSRLFLYTDATLDESRDPVIAYFKPAGPLNARRIAADVDIPIGFWGSWGTTPPAQTINPFKLFYNSEDNALLTSLIGENFAIEQLPEDEKNDAKWYWNDYITGTKRPMFKQKYSDNAVDAEYPQYSLTLSENMDGTGYSGEWVSSIGPVGETYASNLPYPVYSLKRGIVPTSLLYVRDINTNEVLWGDPKLDPAYNSVGELTGDNALTTVCGGHGVITVEGEGTVNIFTTSGTLFATVNAPATVNAAPGLYIAVSGTKSTKLIVR